MRLLHDMVVAAAFATAVASMHTDDSACSSSGEGAAQQQGHRSLIHRQSILELSHEGSSRSSSKVDAASIAHRKRLDEFVLQLIGQTNVDIHQDIAELNDFLAKQGLAITEGHTDENVAILKNQTDTYDSWTKIWALNTVCETGFNAGHSALRFLSQTDAHVYEFDLCDHNYVQPSGLYLYGKYPGRLHLTCGDSKATVPQFIKTYPDLKCDLVIIDGGHDLDTATADLINLAKMGRDKAAVAIDDTPCSAGWCEGPNKAWAQFVADGCIADDTRIPLGSSRGFSFGFLQPCARLQGIA